MPVLTTNRGCPFTCTFCAEGNKYYSVVNKLNLDRVRGEIEYIAKRVVNTNARKDIYISDSNFGMYKEDLAVADIFAEVKQKYNWPQFILATTGKNHKTRVIEVSKKLKGEPDMLIANGQLAKKVLGWSPKMNIEKSILNMILWEKYKLKNKKKFIN